MNETHDQIVIYDVIALLMDGITVIMVKINCFPICWSLKRYFENHLSTRAPHVFVLKVTNYSVVETPQFFSNIILIITLK